MSLDLLTAATPHILAIDERNNLRWVITKNFNPPTANSLTIRNVARADGSNPNPSAVPLSTTAREVIANVSSGLWVLSYLCNPDGSRAVPISDDEFTALAVAVRNARRSKAAAVTAAETAREAFRTAEAAVTEATARLTIAEREWNNAI